MKSFGFALATVFLFVTGTALAGEKLSKIKCDDGQIVQYSTAESYCQIWCMEILNQAAI